jgi:hypothetical protein
MAICKECEKWRYEKEDPGSSSGALGICTGAGYINGVYTVQIGEGRHALTRACELFVKGKYDSEESISKESVSYALPEKEKPVKWV